MFLHYLPFGEKQGAGLRLGMMLALAYASVAGYRLYAEPDLSQAAREGVMKTLGIQGTLFVLSFVGFKAAPKPSKSKKN